MNLGIMYWYIVGMTVWGSISDIRRKSVSVLFLAVCATGVIPIAFWEKNVSLSARLFGVLLGGIFLLISRLTKEAIGKGDAAMIGICGGAVGFAVTATILCAGLMLSSVFSLGLLCFRKAGRKTRIPFFPFLAAGEGVFALLVLL